MEGLRAREKAHTREGDAIAAARRRLPMVEVAADNPLLGPDGPMTLLDAFEGRRQMIAYYLRDGDRVFETYWTRRRGAETVDYSYALMDLTVFGRQEAREDSPAGWRRLGHATRTLGGAPDWPPLREERSVGRPTAQWPRVDAGRSDDLGATGTGPAAESGHCH